MAGAPTITVKITKDMIGDALREYVRSELLTLLVDSIDTDKGRLMCRHAFNVAATNGRVYHVTIDDMGE